MNHEKCGGHKFDLTMDSLISDPACTSDEVLLLYRLEVASLTPQITIFRTGTTKPKLPPTHPQRQTSHECCK